MKNNNMYGLQEEFLQIMIKLCIIPDIVYHVIPIPWLHYGNKK